MDKQLFTAHLKLERPRPIYTESAEGFTSTEHTIRLGKGTAVALDKQNKITNQTARPSVNVLQNSAPKNPPAEVAHSRRKNTDRREEEKALPKGQEERRQSEDRRNDKNIAQQKADREKEKLRQQNEMRIQQHRKKKLLAGCEPVMGMNYDCLAMDDYPDNEIVALARRDRDYWLALCGVFFVTFFLGLLGFVPAWLAATACGLTILSVVFAFSPLRTSFFTRPPLRELLEKRKMIEFKALNHIHFLEGKDGLAWRCEKMQKYNPNLGRKLFHGLIRFSKERNIMEVIKERKHIRLYLLFMIEAQKAYKRCQNDYLTNHFKHLDQGWDDSLTDAEAARLEKQYEAEQSAEKETSQATDTTQ